MIRPPMGRLRRLAKMLDNSGRKQQTRPQPAKAVLSGDHAV